MRVLGDGLVEQTPVRRQIWAPATDSTDEIAGQPGTARWRSIRVADQRVLDDLSHQGGPRHVAPPRFARERGVQLRRQLDGEDVHGRMVIRSATVRDTKIVQSAPVLAISLATGYVEISRARDGAELITDDAAEFRAQLQAVTGERIAALDAIESNWACSGFCSESLEAARLELPLRYGLTGKPWSTGVVPHEGGEWTGSEAESGDAAGGG